MSDKPERNRFKSADSAPEYDQNVIKTVNLS